MHPSPQLSTPDKTTNKNSIALQSMSSLMVNFAIDPRPHVHVGYLLVDRPLHPLVHQEVYLTGCYTRANEDLAIMRLEPPVHKDDFKLLAAELWRFFSEVHCAHIVEIQPCVNGDAYVRFSSPLERERFLGPIFTFGSMHCQFLSMMSL